MAVAAQPEQIRLRRCGPFLLGRRIGAGGMAAVFAARQEGLGGVGRLVAVKVMATFLADDPVAKKMFLRESSIATRLEHPNVVRVYDVGNADGELYLAMELVHGATLAAIARAAAGPLPFGAVVSIVSDVARGLHAAHEMRNAEGELLSLVHQDVSPQNVLVGYDGITRLLDFGVARMVAVDGSRTVTVRGKPSYLAPEQLKSTRVDRRADVFALGIVLHELLSGARLFPPDALDGGLAARLRGEAVPDVRERRGDVPAALAEVAARALELAPSARFETAEAMLKALRSAADQANVRAFDPEDLGRWLGDIVPSAWTPAALEREIVTGASLPERSAEIADLATVVPRIRPQGTADPAPPEAASHSSALPDTEPPEPIARRRRLPALYAIGAIAGIAAAVALTRHRTQVDASAPAPPSEAHSAAASPSPEQHAAEAQAIATSPEPTAPAAPETAIRAARSVSNGASVAHALPARIPAPAPTSVPDAVPTSTTAASSPAATAPGKIAVGSTLSGRVSIDGVPHGDSPLPPVTVSPGTHTVSIATTSGSQSQVVAVKPGESVKVRFVF